MPSPARTRNNVSAAITALTVGLTLALSGCSSAPASPTADTLTRTHQTVDTDPATPRAQDTSISDAMARTMALEVIVNSITEGEAKGLTEVSRYDGTATLTVVLDVTQHDHQAAYHRMNGTDEYRLVFGREFFTAYYAQNLANKTSTRVARNLDGSYTLYPQDDENGITYDVTDGLITQAEGVNPQTHKPWATTLTYTVTEDGLNILSKALTALKK